jgi:Flp pilus assembly protein TadG
MTITSASKPVGKQGKRCDDDGGYVAVVLALTLTVLILFAGFAVDIGGWYARAAAMQRAADAAALAGVVWMPNFATANQVALDTAKANGFDDAATTISVVPIAVTGNPRRLKVTIQDTALTQYFSQLAIGSPTITRVATSEYVLPVPLGSPDNTLGNQSNTDTKYLWASISGPGADKNNGDPYSTKCGAGQTGSSCTANLPPTGEYRDWGYVYTIDVPAAGVGRTLTVQVFDAGNYARPNYANVETADSQTVNTSFEMFSPSSFPLDSSSFYSPTISMDSTGSGSTKCTSGGGRWVILDGASASTYENTFATLCSRVISTAGQYHLQVKSSNIPGVTDSGTGWNQFSLKATLSGGGAQPQVYGYGDLSLFNNLPNLSGNLSATFYLAQIDQIHAGKHIIISLFDPGDGQSGTYDVNILKPGGAITPCTYGARGGSTTTVSDCSIITRTTSSGSSGTYNGLWLDIDIGILSTYTCTTDCWWKVRYDFTGVQAGFSPNDRTVWAARLVGDPVHLVDAG